MSDATLQGIVKSASECRPIPGVMVTALDDSQKVVGASTTDEGGEWTLTGTDPIRSIEFRKPGFATRMVSHAELESCVRLLENHVVGYHRKLWHHPGDSAEVFVHATMPYHARLFRHGASKELILDLGEHSAQPQVVPDVPWVADGLPWQPSWDYRLPAHLRPGLYSLALETAGQCFAVPLVIATPPAERGRRAEFAVLANTPTWQAYNFYGGRSKYHSWEEQVCSLNRFTPSWKYHLKQRLKGLLPGSWRRWLRRQTSPPTPAWQLQPLSVHRPFSHSGLDVDNLPAPFTHHLAAGEWRLLAWLEREGIAYDFIACEELHACPELLENYKAVVLNTHCEYVSKEMYGGLHRFHTEQKGWLINLSGNSLYCEVEMTDACLRYVGGLLMDTCADETQLLGVRFTRDDIGSCAPYQIVDPHSWAFANMELPIDLCFGQRSLNQDTPRLTQEMDPSRPGESPGLDGQGASGWETDKLSDTAPGDIQLIAKGMNRFGGADMVVREPAESRGGMFSASSITFSGCLLVDSVASGLVKNVLKRAVGDVQKSSANLDHEFAHKRAG